MAGREIVVVPAQPGAAATENFRAAEFFAGIGLVRLGLESAGFDVVWANDIEPKKHHMYKQHFGRKTDPFVLGDISAVQSADLPADLSLAWASFPCTDLSLAGYRAGLDGKSSSVFWHFTRLLRDAGEARPAVVTLENVVGFATSRGGDDLAAAIRELNELGYSADVIALDARRFVPQSRPRLFIVGALNPPPDSEQPCNELRPEWLQSVFADPTLRTHRANLPAPPAPHTTGLSRLVERMSPADDRWWDQERTDRFLTSLSPIQSDRLRQMIAAREVSYRTAYRRTRKGAAVWEVRADDISGCLRTARGGSSRQALVRAGRNNVRVRWMTPREYARLMGAGEFCLQGIRTNQALFGFGDAVCVPVVQWLACHYLAPLIQGSLAPRAALEALSV